MDSTLSLAFSLTNTKGATALLLGSGISSAAGILTGWGITLDLVQQVAAVEGENPGPDPAAWYQQKYGEEPDYAKLLELLAPTPAERQRILKKYFVPTDEEKEQGLKQPTKAHHAIAELVAKGYIRVILTTNFDPLLEKALELADVHPAVVSDASAIAGMMPLQHEQVTIVKLHGHYLDTRLRNTPQELDTYEPQLDRLLDRVFDEYGLIVCGWSGVWDVALRQALLRCPTRRFSTYWAAKDGWVAEEAKGLVKQRSAQIVSINGADSFFQGLAEKVTALEDLAQPLPVTTAVAVATLKRYLPNPAQRIRLHDLVMAEVDAVWEKAGLLIPTGQPTVENIAQTARAIDKLMERLIQLLSVGAYWGDAAQQGLWLQAVQRFARLKQERPGSSYSVWTEYRSYPLLVAFYAVGLGAMAVGNMNLLLDLLIKSRFRSDYRDELETPASRLFDAVDQNHAMPLWPSKRPLPLNDHLHQVLRPAFVELIPDETGYDELFDRFEYLTSIAFKDIMVKANHQYSDYFRHGRFMVRGGWMGNNTVVDTIKEEISSMGGKWPMLERGLYSGSPTELSEAVAKMDETIRQMRFR